MKKNLALPAAALLAAGSLCSLPALAAKPGAFLVGQFAASQGDVALAASSMMDALDADAANQELRDDAFMLAVLAGSADAPDLAQTLPENPLAQLLLAARAAHDGQWPQAELGFAELPHQKLTDALRPILVAWTQAAQGLADKAMDTLQPALADSALGAIPLLHAALMADATRRDGLALRLYADLAKSQPKPSLQFAEIMASFEARSGDMAAARASIHAAVQNSPELAIAEPGLIAALDHAHAPTALHGIAQALVETAAAASSGKGSGDTAALLVQVAASIEPRMRDAHLLASELASNNKQWRLAASELEKISPADPLSPVVQLRLANLYQRDGKPHAAEAVLRKLSQAFPDSAAPLSNLGDVLADEKKFPEAVDAYDQAVALVRHPDASDWVLFYARGSALEREHQWLRAEADMNRALELSPGQPYVLNFLGYAMADRNQNLPLAHEMIAKALAARPNDGAIVDSLGWVLLREGRTREALHMLERAAEMQPEDASITGHLGDAYWSLGRKIEAEDQWRRALVLHPDPEEEARITSRLKETTR